LPKLDQSEPHIKIYSHLESNLDSFRFDNLDFFYGMSERISVVRPMKPTLPC
jgi:hypothetical protein